MKRKKELAAYSLIVGLLLISCRLPTWLASEIVDFIEPYLPTSTERVQPLPSETVQPDPPLTGEPESIQVVDRTYFEESVDPRYEINGVWPNLEGPEDTLATFNLLSDRLSQEVRDEFLMSVNDRAGESEGSGEAPLSTLTFDYDLTYSDYRIFSFYLLFDQYIAISAHPFSFSHALNYDTSQGEIIQLADLFLPGIDFKEQLKGYIDPVLIDRGFGYTVGTAGEVMDERENWNLLPEGLRINFDIYEVAPYAAGPQYVLIPWEELSAIIDPESPAGVIFE